MGRAAVVGHRALLLCGRAAPAGARPAASPSLPLGRAYEVGPSS